MGKTSSKVKIDIVGKRAFRIDLWKNWKW